MLTQLKSEGRPQKEIDDLKIEELKIKEMYKNPLILAADVFPKPLPMGIIMTLACAGFLMKKPPVEPYTTDAVVVGDETPNPE